MSKFHGRVCATVMIDLGESDDIRSFLGDDVALPALVTVETSGCVIEATHVDVLDEKGEWTGETRDFNREGYEVPGGNIPVHVVYNDSTGERGFYVNGKLVRVFAKGENVFNPWITMRHGLEAAGLVMQYFDLRLKDRTWEEIGRVILDRLQQVE